MLHPQEHILPTAYCHFPKDYINKYSALHPLLLHAFSCKRRIGACSIALTTRVLTLLEILIPIILRACYTCTKTHLLSFVFGEKWKGDCVHHIFSTLWKSCLIIQSMTLCTSSHRHTKYECPHLFPIHSETLDKWGKDIHRMASTTKIDWRNL